MRNWKLMAVLFSVITALAGLATWDEWKTKKEEKEKETTGLLTTIKADTVVAIKFYSKGDSESGDKVPDAKQLNPTPTEVSLKNVNGQWELTSPVQERADQTTISDLLKNITEYKTESEVATDKSKWADFGMESPRRKIELETKDGSKTTVLVGINSPVGFSVYTALSTGDKVFSGSQYLATSTAKTLFDFRDKKFLSLNPSNVKTISMTTLQESLQLTKTDEKWAMSGSVTAQADVTTIKNLLDDITGLKAAEFIDAPEKALKEAFAAKKLPGSFEFAGEGATAKIKFAEYKNALYASVDGRNTIYKLPDDTKLKILKSSKDLRNRQIFEFQSANIEKVTIDGVAHKKVANDWYAEADVAKFDKDGKFTGKAEEKPTGRSHIRGLLVDLEFAKAEEILENKDPVAKKLPSAPKHKVVLQTNDGKDLSIEVWITQENPEMIFLKHSGSDKLFKAKRSLITSLTPASVLPAGDEASKNPAPSN